MSLKTILNKIFKKGRFSSIRNSHIDKTSKIESGCNIVNVEMDRYSFCGYDCDIINAKIGSFCSIANEVKIGGAMHPISWVSTSPVFYEGRDSISKRFSLFERPQDKTTIIGNDVWIGQGAFIKQGITIGNGSIIGMGAVVTKSIPPYSIVGGNPARLIRMRFTPDIIEQLEETKWWEMDDHILVQYACYIREPLKFIEEINKIQNAEGNPLF